MDVTTPYVRQERMYHCPDVRIRNRSQYGYAMNSKLAGKKHSELDKTEPILFDSTILTRNAVGGIETMPIPGRHPTRNGKVDNAILPNGNSMAFVK